MVISELNMKATFQRPCYLLKVELLMSLYTGHWFHKLHWFNSCIFKLNVGHVVGIDRNHTVLCISLKPVPPVKPPVVSRDQNLLDN